MSSDVMKKWQRLADLIDTLGMESAFGDVVSAADFPTLVPRMESATQGAYDETIRFALKDEWTATVDINGGGGDAMLTGDELEDFALFLTYDEVAMMLKTHGYSVAAISWASLGCEFPAADTFTVYPDDGDFPTIENVSIWTEAEDEVSDGMESEDEDGEEHTASIEAESSFDGMGELTIELTVDASVNGESITGTFTHLHEIDVTSCLSYEVAPVPASAFTDPEIELALDAMILEGERLLATQGTSRQDAE